MADPTPPTPEPPAPATPPTPEPTPPAQPAPTATLTQADLDKAVSTETAKAKREALKALADDLGMSIDEAKKLVTDTKAREQAQLSEVERREQAAKDRETAAQTAEAQAKARERGLAVKEALVDAGVRVDRRDQAVALVTLADDATPEDITAAVETLKTGIPEFFAEAPAPGAPRTPGSVPNGPPPGNAPPADKAAAGRAAAEQFLGRTRSTYFPENEKAGAPA